MTTPIFDIHGRDINRFRDLEAVEAPVMAPSLRPQPGKVIAGYDFDANKVLPPPQIRALSWEEQLEWGKAHFMRPTAEAEAAHARGYLDLARGRLAATKQRYPEGEYLRAAYSMWEMMQPFQNTDGTAVTAAAEAVLTADTYLTLPGNHFNAFPGREVWMRVMGKLSVAATPGTFTFRLRYNALAGTILVASGAITPNAALVTDNLWFIDLFVRSIATGMTTTGLTLMAYGRVELANTSGAAADLRAQSMPAGGVAVANVASLDGTVPKALTLTVQPSLATASITCREAWITAIN